MNRRRSDPLTVSQPDLDRARRWPLGQSVTLTKDDGTTFDTRTRSEPWQVCGTWVIMVDGIAGGYALARVKERV